MELDAVRPNRWEVRRSRTRQAITEAAFATFVDGGYLETSVEQLIARAGVSRSTFYAHFSNKLELLEALAREHIEHRHARFRSLTALPDLNEAAIQSWFDNLVCESLSNGKAVALFRLAVALDANIMQQFGAARDDSAAILATRFPGFNVKAGQGRQRACRRVAAHSFVIMIEQFSSGLADGSWPIGTEDTKFALVRMLRDQL
ncbi:TetR/AcrR family transcriptional regulator [Sphingopyxis sp. CCNWLW253]|uniref:TetR/AcrR family transcriptional regulator n=1 Tax=unclassified Sphingopyxis TaxID=2614943 RepID=UPI003012FF3D